ncbi:MAG: hypothetical protein KZQ86_11480, partial [Candidatus Thiodiazotropha sp. (ex Lucinoma kastoroae)]|nr:hypothetical protein [Candidatus Thiodiazotropha sp. (ex Lucinoma kastoroae)]
LQQAFAAGLQRLLQHPGLGSYILVHANACFDAEVYRVLQADLQSRFDQLVSYCREALSEGRELAGAKDDHLVFLKWLAIGFGGVHDLNPSLASYSKRSTAVSRLNIRSKPIDKVVETKSL